MKRLAFLLPILLLSAIGCHGQAPVSTGQSATITWEQSPSCTAAIPCPSFLIGRATVATATTPCPPSNGTTNYAIVATITGNNVTTGVDNTITATGYECWSVQIQQGSPLETG